MSFRTKIFLAILLATSLAIACVGTPLFLGAQRLVDQAADNELNQLAARVDGVIEARIRTAESITSLVATMPRIQRAVKSQDRKGLLRLFSKDFSEFSEQTGVAQFQFHTPDAHSLLRVHNPDKHSDDLSAFRPMVVTANRDATALSGLERGRAGIGIRAIHPITASRKHVGTVEIGLRLDENVLAEMIAGSSGMIEVYIIPDPDIASFEGQETSEYQRVTSGYDGEALLGSQQLQSAIAAREGRGQRKVGAETYRSALHVINDFTGAPVALAHILVPQSAYAATQRQVGLLALAASFAALAIGALLAWLFGGRFTKQLSQVTDRMRQLAKGETKVETSDLRGQGPEMSQFANGLDAFRDGLEETERLRQDDERRQAEQQVVVAQLANGLRKVAEGQLNARIEGDFAPEYRALIADFNSAVTQLSDVISDIADSSTSVNTAAQNIGNAAENLSRRTENAAATLEETATALQEITAAVEDSSKIAQKADTSGKSAIEKARNGNEVVSDAVRAINEIEASSDQITQIVSVIDDIAFQTNLLALNAGVEAARAGEAGSGFALVAGEVRALAQRTTNAAGQIAELIEESSDRVQNGVTLVDQTGSALSEIVAAIESVTRQIGHIAELASQQATGLNDISNAVGNLDSATQKNAGLFVETTDATSNLMQEGHRLKALVGRFSREDPAGAASGATMESPPIADTPDQAAG